jgi:hypothetical protein
MMWGRFPVLLIVFLMRFATPASAATDPARLLGVPISRKQRIRLPRYVLRTCNLALLIVA